MSAVQFFLPYQTATYNGIAQPGAQLYFYTTGTTTPLTIYSNSGLSIPRANPVVANGSGQFPAFYLDGTKTYRLVIKDKSGASLGVDIDPYIPGTIPDAVVLQPYADSATASAAAAATSASGASTSASSASTSATNAATSATSAAGSATSAASSASAASTSIVSVPNATAHAATRSALAVLGSSSGPVYLRESGREGMFVWSSSNLSANVTADPQQGVYVAPASDTSGASGAWVRVRDSDFLHINWFGPHADGVTDDTAAFVALRTLGIALAVNAGSGLRGGPELRLAAKSYLLSSSFSWKGYTAIWRGAGSGHTGFGNYGTAIKMASGCTFYVDRSNTESGTTGTTISAFGGDSSEFHNIAFVGAGKGVGTASVFMARAKHYAYSCLFGNGGGHGCEISATSGSGTTTEGEASNWFHAGCSYTNNGKSGIKTGGSDANAGKAIGGNWTGNTEYGVDEGSFLGNDFDGHFASNTLGPFRVTNANAVCHFSHYIESGQPNAVLNARSYWTGIGGPYVTGPTLGGNNSFVAASPGIQTAVVDGAKTLQLTRGAGGTAVATAPRVDEFTYTDFCSGTTGVTSYFRVGTGIYVPLGIGYATADILMAINGSAGARYQMGLVTAPAGIGFREIYLGDGTGPDGRKIISTTAAPTTGEHAQGEIAFNRSFTAGGTFAWYCTVGGTPGTWVAMTAASGTNTGDQAIALTGPVTGTWAAGSVATTITAAAVTYGKIQNVAASSLLGNPTGGATAPSEITLAGGLAFSGTTLTAAGALTPTSIASTGAMTSSSAAAGSGYATGAGGAVTQATSRTTGVTLSKPCGAITLFSAAGSATYSTFTVTNTLVAATDTIEVSQKSGANLYNILVTAVAAGSFNLSVSAVSGTATEAPVINFVLTKAVAA